MSLSNFFCFRIAQYILFARLKHILNMNRIETRSCAPAKALDRSSIAVFFYFSYTAWTKQILTARFQWVVHAARWHSNVPGNLTTVINNSIIFYYLFTMICWNNFRYWQIDKKQYDKKRNIWWCRSSSKSKYNLKLHKKNIFAHWFLNMFHAYQG